MKHVYKLTALGWVRVFTAQSFTHACRVCMEMQAKSPNDQFCVNN